MNEDVLAQCTPGIRDVVRWLWDQGFKTSDSGDGVTNVAAGMDGACTFPMVVITATQANLFRQADKLYDLLEAKGIEVDGFHVGIEASYDPTSGACFIVLRGVNNEGLADPNTIDRSESPFASEEP